MGIISFRESVQKSFSKTPIHFQWGWILTVIGLLFLRFWRINERDLGYDELSAILRALGATTWQQHLHQGVIIDGHPAGLQTILWIWVQAFGSNVLPLRLLTAGIGLFTLFQSHQLAKRLFGFETAYWTVVMMGLMWWQVSMGIWIRPYVWALPFVLWAWDLVFRALNDANRMANGNEIINPNDAATSILQDITEISPAGRMNKPTSMGWFSLQLGGALAGAAYFHYCAGLAAGAAFLIFLLFSKKPIVSSSQHTQGIHPSTALFLPFTIAFVLYLPHLPVFYAQMQLKGLGWLAKPNISFIPQFFQYANGQNTALSAIFIAALAYAVVHSIQRAYLPKPVRFGRIAKQPEILMLLGCIIVFLIIYTYSIYRAPILQNNALYFISPLLILLAAQGITQFRNSVKFKTGNKLTNALAIALPLFLLFNSIVEKSWFNLGIKAVHPTIIKAVEKEFANNRLFYSRTYPNGQSKCNAYLSLVVWLDGPNDNYLYHLQHITNPPAVNFLQQPQPLLYTVAKSLKELKPKQTVFLGIQSGSEPWLLPLVESHFQESTRNSNSNKNPNSNANSQHEFLVGGEWLTLSKPRTPDFTAADFHLSSSKLIYNTADTTSMNEEFTLGDFKPNKNDVIVIVVPIKTTVNQTLQPPFGETFLSQPTNPSNTEIQSSLWNGNKQIDWRSSSTKNYSEQGFQYALHTIKLADIPNWTPNTQIRIHMDFCNKFLIGCYKGNPYLYSE